MAKLGAIGLEVKLSGSGAEPGMVWTPRGLCLEPWWSSCVLVWSLELLVVSLPWCMRVCGFNGFVGRVVLGPWTAAWVAYVSPLESSRVLLGVRSESGLVSYVSGSLQEIGCEVGEGFMLSGWCVFVQDVTWCCELGLGSLLGARSGPGVVS